VFSSAYRSFTSPPLALWLDSVDLIAPSGHRTPSLLCISPFIKSLARLSERRLLLVTVRSSKQLRTIWPAP
ncbi:uncharacterized protein L969DRAFT_48982, partial [Mixia osmundae IAM 14324]|uniref:uncharacterized protein n=1 Tax=Mixia osmundae (strain CBS 9802 / IAM 14324 / JCM 22182 / KY 12970) TaxID=764103 RepID=UPI0004A55A42